MNHAISENSNFEENHPENSLDVKSITRGIVDNPEAILFDLDGTLVDSAADLKQALNQTLLALGMKPRSTQQVHQWIGNGVNKLLHRGLTNSMDGIASDDDFWRAKNIFNIEYERQSGRESSLYPGVMQSLDKLSTYSILMVCVTNKDRRFTLPLLKKMDILQYFDVIVCGDDLNNKKPHPEPLLYAVNKLNIKPEKCVMVGDSASDVGAANAAKIPMICVDYGYSQGIDLNKLDIDVMISSIHQIEKHFVKT